MSEDVISPNKEYMHKWMYSFLPAGHDNKLYLTSFCPECRNAATVLLDRMETVIGKTLFTQTNLPRFGCVEPYQQTLKLDGLKGIPSN